MRRGRKTRARQEHRLDDASIFDRGCRALERELGVLGMLQFLQACGRDRSRYTDVRKPLLRMSLQEIAQDMTRRGLVTGRRGRR